MSLAARRLDRKVLKELKANPDPDVDVEIVDEAMEPNGSHGRNSRKELNQSGRHFASED